MLQPMPYLRSSQRPKCPRHIRWVHPCHSCPACTVLYTGPRNQPVDECFIDGGPVDHDTFAAILAADCLDAQ